MKKPRPSIVFGIATLFALCLANDALGYGNKGHETVGAIADELIQGTPAEAKVKALLPDMTLSEAATWADRAKGSQGPLTQEMQAFVTPNQDHHHYHFTDVPIQLTQYHLGDAGTSPLDIVQISTQCINVLKGNDTPATNPHGFSPRIALILLAHLVGDMHQPLHVGAAYLNNKHRFVNPITASGTVHEDHGGNFLKFVETWPKQWADDMLPIAAKAHKGFKIEKPITVTDNFGTHLQWKVTPPTGYANFARDTVDERLTTGGFRLALQAIWP